MGVRALPCGLDYVLFPLRLLGVDGFSVVLTAYGPRIWHPLVRCLTGVQVCGVFWEIPSRNVPVFSACWFDSGHKFASVHGALSHFSAMLGSTVDTKLRQSTVLFRISAQCLVRQWIHIVALVVVLAVALLAGLLVTMISRCGHFVVGSPWSLHRCTCCDSSSCLLCQLG